MRHRELSFLSAAAAAVVALFVFSSCQTATVTRTLPPYEPPIAKSDVQHVRTTAYTHTEADHRQYGAKNALGGDLHPASGTIRRASNTIRPRPFSEYKRVAYSDSPHERFSTNEDIMIVTVTKVKTRAVKSRHPVKRGKAVKKPTIGSAAADWSRWPAGTTFRLVSTGQIYRVEDYGWALAGRNTIDLYMDSPHAMNSWGAREEPIQILHWGDPDESLRVLLPRQRSKHIRRMVLELQGNEQEAAELR